MNTRRNVIGIALVVLVGIGAFSWAERERTSGTQRVVRHEGVDLHLTFDADGKRHGPWKGYFPDGRLAEEGDAQHGVTVWRKSYYPSGALRVEFQSGDNHLLTMRMYAEDGTLLH